MGKFWGFVHPAKGRAEIGGIRALPRERSVHAAEMSAGNESRGLTQHFLHSLPAPRCCGVNAAFRGGEARAGRPRSWRLNSSSRRPAAGTRPAAAARPRTRRCPRAGKAAAGRLRALPPAERGIHAAGAWIAKGAADLPGASLPGEPLGGIFSTIWIRVRTRPSSSMLVASGGGGRGAGVGGLSVLGSENCMSFVSGHASEL